jgi:hypothetical protein
MGVVAKYLGEKCLMSYVLCLMSYVLCLMSYVLCLQQSLLYSFAFVLPLTYDIRLLTLSIHYISQKPQSLLVGQHGNPEQNQHQLHVAFPGFLHFLPILLWF